MLKRIAFLVLLLMGTQLSAKSLLADLDFSSGRWVMVGVSLHNYRLLPIQMDLGTFIVKDPAVLREMKQDWDFEEKFDDYCDYHYALKFYRNGDLVKTLKLNMVCNYVTDGGLSYEYDEEDFMAFRKHYQAIRWSRIRFKNLELLQESVPILDQLPGVYWYGDVQQYNFDGEFSINVSDIPWNADRDSVIAEVTHALQDRYKRDDFYVTTKYWLISDDFNWMTMRLNVYCDQDFFRNYDRDDVITRWRNHFSEQSFVQIMVIGLSKKEYFAKMH